MLAIVVVTHDPDLDALQRLVERIAPAAATIVAVDNGSADQAGVAELHKRLGVVGVLSSDNGGLAWAQNLGIDQARRMGASRVLLLDQDSSLDASHVAVLGAALDNLIAEGKRVAAVGPAYTEVNTARPMPLPRARRITIDWGRGVDGELSPRGLPIEVDYVIASGALMPMAAIDQAGSMDDRLFIDLVDVDWGLRARAAGLRSYIVPPVRAGHTIGRGYLVVAGRRVVLHSPMRNYFWARNAVALCRRQHVGLPWKLFLLRRVVIYTVAYPLFADRKLVRLRRFLLGGWHGLTGVWSPPRHIHGD